MITLLDVTLRDGGLANNFAFTETDAVDIVEGLGASGIEQVEVGYYRPRDHGRVTGAKVCDLPYLGRLARLRKRPRLAVMVHTEEVETGDYAALRDCDISLVRFPVSRKNLPGIRAHLEAVRAAGLAFTLNIIRVSELDPNTVLELGALAESSGASAVYFADSNGGLYPEQVAYTAGLLGSRLRIPLGFHAHDNLTLAFANSLVALRHGVSYFDTSLGGLGKGGCNLITELMAVFLNVKFGKDYDVFRLAEVADRNVASWLPQKFAERFDSSVLGALDFNLDRIVAMRRRAEAGGPSFRALLEEHYRERRERFGALLQEAV
jgi:4-hydroxy 2-oxovalerate aldolase